MKIEMTPEQLADRVAMLGAADSLFRDLAAKPETNGLFRLMLRRWATDARELQAALTEAFNAERQP